MAMRLSLPFEKTFTVAKDPKSSYAFLSDLDRSVSGSFPGLQRLEKISEGVYRWHFKELEYSGQKIQLGLVTRFEGDGSRFLRIFPVSTPGQGDLSGEWELQPEGSGTRIRFAAKIEIELNIPFFLKAVAGPLAQKELSKLFERYLNNVEKNLAA